MHLAAAHEQSFQAGYQNSNLCMSARRRPQRSRHKVPCVSEDVHGPLSMFLCAECGDVLTSRDELRRHLATAHQHGNVAESSEDEDLDEDIINKAGQTAGLPTAIASAEAGPSSASSNQPEVKSRRHRERSQRQPAVNLEGAETTHAAEGVPNEVASGHSRTGSRRGGRGLRPRGRAAVVATGASAGTAAHGANDAEGVVAGLHVSDALNAAKHAVAELWVPQRKPNPGANGAKVTLLRRPQADSPATPSAGVTAPPTVEPNHQPGRADAGTRAAHDMGTAPAAAATSASRRRRRRPPPRRCAASIVEDIAAVEAEPDSVDDTPAVEQAGRTSSATGAASSKLTTVPAALGTERPEHSRGRSGRSRTRPRSHGSKQGTVSNHSPAVAAAGMDVSDVRGVAAPLEKAEAVVAGGVAETQADSSGKRGGRSGRGPRARGKAAATSTSAETGEDVAAVPMKVMWRPKSNETVVVAAAAGSGSNSSAADGTAGATGAAAPSSSAPSVANAGSGTHTAVGSAPPLSRRYGKRRPVPVGNAAAGPVDGITAITASMEGMAVA